MTTEPQSGLRRHGWLILAPAFAALIAVIGLSGFALYREVAAIKVSALEAQSEYVQRHQALNDLRVEILALAIELRDYLLDPGSSDMADPVTRLTAHRQSIADSLSRVEKLFGSEQVVRSGELRESFDSYWQWIDLVLRLDPAQIRAMGIFLLRQRTRPSRRAILEVATDLDGLNATLVKKRQDDVGAALDRVQSRLRTVLGAASALGVIIAVVTVFRLRTLEHRTEQQQRQVAQAAGELRRLSRKLVRAQEDERRSISRELHDEVGQTLTALRLELGNVEEAARRRGSPSDPGLETAGKLAEQALQTVRELARGLRPAMLDDLGLSAALQWQAREFSAHSQISASVQVEGEVDQLPDSHRTCVYRVVQEALTNCARHSRAKEVRVLLHGAAHGLSLTVQDDGIGFDLAAASGRGLGLVGMEERARELGGSMSILSPAGRGTILQVDLPAPQGARS